MWRDCCCRMAVVVGLMVRLDGGHCCRVASDVRWILVGRDWLLF